MIARRDKGYMTARRVKGYMIARKDKEIKGGGGLALLMRENIMFQEKLMAGPFIHAGKNYCEKDVHSETHNL